MSAEKLDTEIRREQIAQAALALVAWHGMRALTVAAVARRAGLVPSAIYRHFRSKDDLLKAVLHLIQDRLLSNVEAVCGETPDPRGAASAVLLRHAQLIREYQALPRVIFSDAVYSGHPERKAQVRQVIKGYLDRVADIIRQGQQQDRIRAGIDPTTAAVMLLGLVQPAAILWHVTDGGFDVTKHVEKAWRVFREAIVSE